MALLSAPLPFTITRQAAMTYRALRKHFPAVRATARFPRGSSAKFFRHQLFAQGDRPADTHVRRDVANLTVSLQAALPQQWLGQPELLGALLQHMLLIGLKRTRTGLVCMRLYAPSFSMNRLHIAFEDSGPAIQTWQLQQWLAPAREETPLAFTDEDISWLLVARLIRRLGGSIKGASREEGGLTLEGSIPLTIREPIPQDLPNVRPALAVHDSPPLVLVVEGDSSLRMQLAPLFDTSQYRIFTVKNHTQMAEWCCLLPFSALILNFAFPDGSRDALRKLTHMRETGMLRDIPFWAIADINSQTGFGDPLIQPMAGLFMLPLRQQQIKRFCAELQSPPADFYLEHDTDLRRDFSDVVNQSLSHMNSMLGSQIARLLALIKAQAQEDCAKTLLYEVHGVKSAALSLGYFRLAGFMGQIEHAAHQNALASQNWAIIVQVLQDSGFTETAATEDQNPAQRRATSL